MRLLLFFAVVTAFLLPLVAVLAAEKNRQATKALAMQQEYADAKTQADSARYQYYLEISQRKDALKQAMRDAKTQYEQLLKEQPDKIKEKQTAVTQTTIQPVVVQKEVTQTVSTSSKPKTSTKTKTS